MGELGLRVVNYAAVVFVPNRAFVFPCNRCIVGRKYAELHVELMNREFF